MLLCCFPYNKFPATSSCLGQCPLWYLADNNYLRDIPQNSATSVAAFHLNVGIHNHKLSVWNIFLVLVTGFKVSLISRILLSSQNFYAGTFKKKICLVAPTLFALSNFIFTQKGQRWQMDALFFFSFMLKILY